MPAVRCRRRPAEGHRRGWTTGFGIVPKLPAIMADIARVSAHPVMLRAAELDAGGAGAPAAD